MSLNVHIAGPARPGNAADTAAFAAASEHLEAAGHHGSGASSAELDPKTDTELTFELLAWIIREADAVLVLPGWEASPAAAAQVAVARARNLPVGPAEAFTADGFQPLEERIAPVTALHGASEVRVTSSTGGQKGSKIAAYHLIPAGPLWELATLYGMGAIKYANRNWEAGYDLSLSFAAMMRHAWSWWNGEELDPETGISHLASVAWHSFTLSQLQITHPQFDDRPARIPFRMPDPEALLFKVAAERAAA